MPVSIDTAPSPTKAWALDITPDAAGITIGAGSVHFFGERFDVPEIYIPCVYGDESADYRIALCRTPTGAALALVSRGAGGIEDLPDDHEEVIYLARWRLAELGDTCASVTVHATQRTADGELPPPDTTTVVDATPVIPAEPPERTAARQKRSRLAEINAKGATASFAERIERLEIHAGIRIETEE